MMVFLFSFFKCYLRDKKCEKRSVEFYCLGKVKILFIVDFNKDFNLLVDFKNFFFVFLLYWIFLEINVCIM